MQHFEPGTMATVLYAICHPRLQWARIASAGHWPPVLAAPERPTVEVDLPRDVLIGIDADPHRRSATVEIPAGGLLCFYTDGLIERRDTSLDTNLRRLYESIVPGHPAEAVCAAVMAALIGREVISDDVALLTLRSQNV